MSRNPMLASTVFALGFCAQAVHADEGMWTFDNFPSSRVQTRFGFAPDAAWLDHVRSSSRCSHPTEYLSAYSAL